MRHVLFPAGAVLCAAVAIAGAQARGTASLLLVRTQPVVVSGARFHARERVRVTLVASSGSYARHVIATRNGRFVVTFSGVPVDRCGAIQVSAAGNRGSRAVVKRPPLPACMPA
jgi:hypothetical protein